LIRDFDRQNLRVLVLACGIDLSRKKSGSKESNILKAQITDRGEIRMTNSWIEEIFGYRKPIIGMCHLRTMWMKNA